MSGEDNIYKYITTEGKIIGRASKKFTMLEYLQKSTGVFNQNGMLSKKEVKAMKQRAQTGEKNLWSGFISFNKENSDKIDDPEKCIALVKEVFADFFRDAKFDPDNMDLMCALHLDRPEHLHIHFQFWEKEPKVKNKRAAGYIYRKKGKIPLDVIDRMTERLNAYTIDDQLAEKREAVLDALKSTYGYWKAAEKDAIYENLKALADNLPKDIPLRYGTKEMKPYRDDIDWAASWLIDSNERVSRADKAFRDELRMKKEKLQSIMGSYYKARIKEEMSMAEILPDTSDAFGVKQIHTIEKLEWDYKRRIGNIVLRKVREIQSETFHRKPNRKYKTNDPKLKRSLAISRRKVSGIIDGFMSSVFELFMPETRTYSNRLHEIEKEIEQAHIEEEQKNIRTNSRWDWSK